jgi:hypothetical protein
MGCHPFAIEIHRLEPSNGAGSGEDDEGVSRSEWFVDYQEASGAGAGSRGAEQDDDEGKEGYTRKQTARAAEPV